MKKYISYRVEANGGDIDRSSQSYWDAVKFYGTVNGDKMLSGTDSFGKRHPIVWSGKCRVR